jgi:hypothetical protein
LKCTNVKAQNLYNRNNINFAIHCNHRVAAI